MSLDPLKTQPENVRVRAQREIIMLRMLQDGPLTMKEIAERMNINPRTVQSMVNDLKAANVIVRRRGARKISLYPPEFLDLQRYESEGTLFPHLKPGE